MHFDSCPDAKAKHDGRWGFFHVSLLWYVVGLLLTHVISEVFQSPQPALLYLAPAVLVSTYVHAWRRALLGGMWTHQGRTGPKKDKQGGEIPPGEFIV